MLKFPVLKIALFSPLSIERDGRQLKLASRRTEALLVYLIRNPQIHARDVLATLFWNDLPQKKAMGNLRVLLANLRKELDPYVTITRQTAAFKSDANVQLDVADLEKILATGRDEIDWNGSFSKQTATKLSKAIELYRGELLPGFYLKDGLGFEEWLTIEREWLWSNVVDGLSDLATDYLQWGDYRTGIEQAKRLVNLDPIREEGHQLLMQLFAADGQTNTALAQYDRCVKILDKEMGVQPQPYTTELFEKIRAGNWELPTSKLEPKQVAKAIRHNLPRPMSGFVGRDSELLQLENLLADETVPIISIIGPGGMGKTVLALETARKCVREQKETFNNGIFFIPLGQIDDDALLPLSLAESIGFQFQKDGGDESAQILRYLEDQAMLIVFDNAEHLIEQTDLFSEILSAAPLVKLLITSRHKLNLQGETVLLLDGLAYPSINSRPEQTEHHASVQLFLESVRRTNGNVQFGQADVHAIGEICRLVEGMPLAILLAAANIELLTPVEIGAEISQDVAILRTKGGHEFPSRQQSMQAVFNQSWNLLTSAEQQVFARMSIFQIGCVRPVAQAVTGGSLRDLLSLTQKSLLEREVSTGRFTIHNLLRQMAAEKLAQSGQSAVELHQLAFETIEKLHPNNLAPHFGNLAHHAEQGRLTDKACHYNKSAADQARNLYQNNLAIEYYGRALTLTPANDLDDLYQIRLQRVGIFHLLGRRENQLEEINSLEKIVEPLGDDDKRGELFVKKARYAEAMGDYTGSQAEAEKAVKFGTKGNARHVLAEANLAWGNALSRQGQFDEAKGKLEAAVDHAQAANLPLLAGQSYQILGIDSVYQGDHTAAKKYFEQNIEIFRRLENRPGEAAGLGNLGILMMMQCNYAEALKYIEQTVEIFHEIDDVRNETIGLINIGSTAYKLGQFEKAEKNYEQGLALAIQTADLQSQREAHNLLGNFFADRSNNQKSKTHYKLALELARSINSAGHIVESQAGLATLALSDGNRPEAVSMLGEVIADLNAETLAQADDILRVYLGAYQILQVDKPKEAASILETAHTHLQNLAGQIEDSELRRYFLDEVPIHKTIVAEFEG